LASTRPVSIVLHSIPLFKANLDSLASFSLTLSS
jgi:hypothetical protein